jgi:hypothetical protein
MFGCDKYNIKPDLLTIAKVGFILNMKASKVFWEHYEIL